MRGVGGSDSVYMGGTWRAEDTGAAAECNDWRAETEAPLTRGRAAPGPVSTRRADSRHLIREALEFWPMVTVRWSRGMLRVRSRFAVA